MSLAEVMLRPLAGVLNRRIRLSSQALEICQQQAGRTVAVRLSDSAIAATLSLEPDGIVLSGPSEIEPDVLLEGTLTGLLAMGGKEPLAPIRDGRVTLRGDAGTAEAVQRLFALAKPDLEDDLAVVVGDTAARTLAEGARRAREFGERRLKENGQRLAEGITARENLPRIDELDELAVGIRSARDHAERLQARIRRAMARQNTQETD